MIMCYISSVWKTPRFFHAREKAYMEAYKMTHKKTQFSEELNIIKALEDFQIESEAEKMRRYAV